MIELGKYSRLKQSEVERLGAVPDYWTVSTSFTVLQEHNSSNKNKNVIF